MIEVSNEEAVKMVEEKIANLLRSVDKGGVPFVRYDPTLFNEIEASACGVRWDLGPTPASAVGSDKLDAAEKLLANVLRSAEDAVEAGVTKAKNLRREVSRVELSVARIRAGIVVSRGDNTEVVTGAETPAKVAKKPRKKS